jgi:L-fucose isomerase-like protein
MKVKLKPVLILGTNVPHVFPQPNGQLDVTVDSEISKSRAENRHQELIKNLNSDVEFLPPAFIYNKADVNQLKKTAGEADLLLVYLSAGIDKNGPLEKSIWEISASTPIIGFSGQCTPMMGMYNLPAEEREYYPNVSYAIDYADIDEQVRFQSIMKRLRRTRIVLLGRHDRETYYWQQMPDPVLARRKMGIEFIPVSGTEFLSMLGSLEKSEVEAATQEWITNAKAVAEPSENEIREVAKTYVAMKKLLSQTGSQAISVGCLELMYGFNIPAMCFSLAQLRDEGFPAGCEGDASATLTSVILEYLTDKPAYMGNLVHADAANKLVMISHGCSPAKTAGRDLPPKPYTLVHSHSVPPFTKTIEGGGGVTSYVDYLEDKGQPLTIARIGANVDRIAAATGELVDCRDTICDRTTITIKMKDPKRFVQNTTGNHQVVVWGDCMEDLRNLCRMLEISLIES